MLIAVFSVLSFGIIKYQEILVMAASNETAQEVKARLEQADSALVADLARVGIQVARVGELPLVSVDLTTPLTQTTFATETTITAAYYNSMTKLMADYDREIDNLYQTAKIDYLEIPKGDRTPDKKLQIGMKYADIAEGLEISADAQFEEMLVSFKNELASNGFDHAIVQEVRAYYNEYKSIQKHYYMTKLKSN